jgi:hypothetical protein
MRTRRVAGICSSVVCLLICLAPSQGKAGTDFLVIEHVDRLQVYNKYQQEATAQERRQLVPFAPMNIVKANDTLSDGFTRCMQIGVGGQIFFLLKDSDNRFIRSGPLGYERTFTNTSILNDTVQVLTRNSVQISMIDSRTHYLASGDLILRIFRQGNLTYCQTLSNNRFYGWVDFNAKGNHGTWKVVKRVAQSDESLSPVIVHRIEKQIAEVNRVLARLYDFFNHQTHQSKSPPQWNVESSNGAVLCTLQGQPGGEAFGQSTFYLVNEIENSVLGSEFHVIHSPGSIEIRNR